MYVLVQVRCTATQRSELRDLAQIFRLAVIDVSHTSITLEAQGRENKMQAIVDLLEPYGAQGWVGGVSLGLGGSIMDFWERGPLISGVGP